MSSIPLLKWGFLGRKHFESDENLTKWLVILMNWQQEEYFVGIQNWSISAQMSNVLSEYVENYLNRLMVNKKFVQESFVIIILSYNEYFISDELSAR